MYRPGFHRTIPNPSCSVPSDARPAAQTRLKAETRARSLQLSLLLLLHSLLSAHLLSFAPFPEVQASEPPARALPSAQHEITRNPC